MTIKANLYYALYRGNRLLCVEKLQGDCMLFAEILTERPWKEVDHLFKLVHVTVDKVKK